MRRETVQSRPEEENLGMLISEDRIRAAILHPIGSVRAHALEFWRGEHRLDPTVMPIVIEAARKYGHAESFALLRRADDLAQTAETLDWLMDELKQPLDLENVDEDNYRFAVALILVHAEPALLIPRHRAILGLPGFPAQLAEALDNRLRFSLLEWPALWQELEDYGRRLLTEEAYSLKDHRFSNNLVEAMGRHREGADHVMQAIDLKVPEAKRDLAECLLPELLRVAGKMKLRSAIERLFYYLSQNDEGDALLDACIFGLSDIGLDRVVESVAMAWRTASSDTRGAFCDVLDNIRSDCSFRWSVRLLEEADDFEVALRLGTVVLDQFQTDGLSIAREIALNAAQELEAEPDDFLGREVRDLRYDLVIMSHIAGIGFPELAAWQSAAEQDDYGWFGHTAVRIAENF